MEVLICMHSVGVNGFIDNPESNLTLSQHFATTPPQFHVSSLINTCPGKC